MLEHDIIKLSTQHMRSARWHVPRSSDMSVDRGRARPREAEAREKEERSRSMLNSSELDRDATAITSRVPCV